MTEKICSKCGCDMDFNTTIAACRCPMCAYESPLFEACGLIFGKNKYHDAKRIIRDVRVSESS
jgi:predicted amidophosphoribosyltransferase